MCPHRNKEKDWCPHLSGNYAYDMCEPQTGLAVMNVSPKGQEKDWCPHVSGNYDYNTKQVW